MPTSQTTQHQRTTQQHRSNNSNRASSQARSSYQTRFNETTKPVSELFEQAMNSYEQAFRTGLKLQEESSKWFTSMIEQAGQETNDQQRVALYNKLGKQTSLTEKGEVVNGRGDNPNRHDMLTGSQMDGTAFAGDPMKTTCGNWTSSSADGSAALGHHDRQGGGTNPTSWNYAHLSKGCSQGNLQGTGGDGLFYCFARD